MLGCLSCLIGGASWSGVNLAQTSVMLGFSDRAGGSKAVASASVLISFGGLLGGLAGGGIAQLLENMPQLTQFLWGNFQVCFLASLVIRLGGIGFLLGMPDPGAASVGAMLQQMRNNIFNVLFSRWSYPLRILGWDRDARREGRGAKGEGQKKKGD
jgi:hypothetical protein